MPLLSRFSHADMDIRYELDPAAGRIGLQLIPASLTGIVAEEKKYAVDSLVQIKLIGDDYPGGFAHGLTMRNSGSVAKFRYESQRVETAADSRQIVTVLRHADRPCLLEHRLICYDGYDALESVTAILNEGEKPVDIEMMSSFSLGGITPFEGGEATGCLHLHRLRSKWSNEGRLETIAIEDLQLEPSWAGHGANSERFGQAGSMPVRGFFPFAAVEDRTRGVFWAAQLAAPASWQMEAYRRDDALCLSGGLADREFGHWVKRLPPGASFAAPAAYLTVCAGDIDDASQRLTGLQARALDVPASEEGLPVVFNEFCTTWGWPSQENIARIAGRLKDKGIAYFVIDAGWYMEKDKGWESNMGDWNVSPELFPNGLEAAVQEIRDAGMIPGIWFELENCGPLAEVYGWQEHLLRRDGIPITVGHRRFWDFRDPFVIGHLTGKVIDFLKRYRFGYLKIDYNESIGIGCDGAESLGEGLRQHMAAVQSFLARIREELPELVIENCSSGGHRLEPSMMKLTSMASFSDAHEETEIPIIAANVHRAILPKQSQIWAVLRKQDSERRLIYSLVNTFLGRMCLSGDVNDLDEGQWSVVDEAISFYQEIAPLIGDGVSRRYGPKVSSYRKPEGWQAVVRSSRDGAGAVAIMHSFGGELPERIAIPLPSGRSYAVRRSFAEGREEFALEAGSLIWTPPGSFAAAAVLLEEA